MEQAIRDQYNEGILLEAIDRFGVSLEQVQNLGGFESYVFEYIKDGQPYILRLSHSRRRSVNQIQGEMEWINYLKAQGLTVSLAVASERGNLVEKIESADGYFSAVSFEKAPGQQVSREEWTPEFFQKLGQYMGKMHALTKNYQPPSVEATRGQWDRDIDYPEKYLSATDAGVKEKFNELVERFRQLPKDRESYGLIHVDLHRGNFFVHQGEIYAFDFDDSLHSWFVHDIAIAIFYALPHHCESPEQLEHARIFYDNFMAGYRRENDVAEQWLKEIPYFLKWREIELYTTIIRSFDLDNLNEWCASFMRKRREKILNDVPYVDLDFTR